MTILNSISTILLILSSASCSSHIDKKEKFGIEVETSKINAWLNLMPGSTGSFHVSGELKIRYDSASRNKNNEKEALDSILVKQVEVYQDENLLYSFVPEFESKRYNVGNVLISFNSLQKLNINKKLNPEKNVSLIISFYSGKKIFNYEAKEIKVEKTY